MYTYRVYTRQIYELGSRSLPLIAAAGFAVGAVLSMLLATHLGFAAVLLIGAVLYAGAATLAPGRGD